MSQSKFRPWLYLSPEMAHKIGPPLLRASTSLKPWPKLPSTKKIWGLDFKSSLGTAGGLDKEAKDLSTWTKLQAGFLEIGTFTPEPQGPNPGKIIDRSTKENALWNCMGFPNAGFKAVLPRIERFKKNCPSPPPLFINIGKNRQTSLEEAHQDYVQGIQFFKDLADVFVVNISSPNTKGLRLLHQKENFLKFLDPILSENQKKSTPLPLLIKVSPDLEEDDFKNFLKDLKDLKEVSGLILTNTTQKRPTQVQFPERGGLSGGPLASLSKARLQQAKEILQDSKILVSAGGVLYPQDVQERLSLGADLVQVYSGLIFYGPQLFEDCVRI